MVESRIEGITRSLAATRERRGLMSLLGGVLLGGAVTAELSAPEAAADRQRKTKRRHGQPGRRGPTGPAGPSGPAGAGSCPADTTFIAAVGCVETAPRASIAPWTSALSTCGNAGRRLLTSAELYALLSIPGAATSVSLQPVEWTGNITAHDNVFVAGTDPMLTDDQPITAPGPDFPYRCVQMPAIAT
jgi:hypothetical protein